MKLQVLDRLNPLLEPNGVIMVNERGLVRGEALVVRAHPNFRLFLTMDPSHGEISRAMRNRGVEIYMLPLDFATSCSDPISIGDVRGDEKQLVVGAGIPGCALVEGITRAHFSFKSFLHARLESTDVSLRDLSQWVSLFQELLRRGATLTKALSCSWEQHYVRRLYSVTGRSAAVQIYHESLAGVCTIGASKLNGISLQLPGGWPWPLSAESYVKHSTESVVRRDAMLVDGLGVQLVSYNLARQWNLDRKGSLSDNLSVWLMDKRHLLPYLPDHMLRCLLFPLEEEVSGCPETISSSVDLVELEQLLKHAALWMVKEGTFADLKFRIQWLRELSSVINGHSNQLKIVISSVEREIEHPLHGKLHGAWLELEGGISVGEQPYILDRMDPGPQDNGMYLVVCLSSKVLALRRCLLQQLLEDAAYEHAEVHGPGRHPTVAINSYWHWTHRTEESRRPIEDQALLWMYRVLSLLRQLEDNILQSCACQTWNDVLKIHFDILQEWHEALWKVLQSSKLDYDEFLLCWSFLKSSLHQLLGLPSLSAGLEVTFMLFCGFCKM